MAALFGRGKRTPVAKAVAESSQARIARISAETGVSVKSLTLFSRIAEHKGFTAGEAHKDFGRVKLKEIA